jgi:hypothetical protein
MTPQEAICRLQSRDNYVARKITELQAEGHQTFWFEQDRESIALAISALEYLHQVQEYEASQKQL